MIRKILSRFSEPYRIRNGWGSDCVRNAREAKALYEFCRNWLVEREGTQEYELNPDRVKIYRNTIYLYLMEFDDTLWGLDKESKDENGIFELVNCTCPHCKYDLHEYYSFFEYANDHCGWYWT